MELQNGVAERFGSAVELMKLDRGIFDEAAVSAIDLPTISAAGAHPLRSA